VILETSVAIVGSGMGGSTTAYGLAKAGIDCIVIERGDYVKKEDANWSAREIFINQKYKPNEKWLDQNGKEFTPGLHYIVGGNTKVYGASLPRFRESDFAQIQHKEGISPAWPFTYNDLEPYYCAAEQLYKVHGTTGEDPTEPKRSKPFPYPPLAHEPYIANLLERLKKAGVKPHSNSMGVDLASDGACIRCGTCDGFICKLDAKSDAQTCALNPAIKTGHVKLERNLKVTKVVTNGRRVEYLLAERDGVEVKIYAKKYVLSLGAVNTAALLLRSGQVANSSGLVGKNFMMHNNAHIAAFDARKTNDVTFQKTLSFSDWYFDGGNGYPLGSVQLIGKVQGIMMKSYVTKAPLPVLNYIANRSVEFVVMNEDLPSLNNRVEITKSGGIQIFRKALNTSAHKEMMRKTKRVLRKAGFQGIFVQPFDISMNSHQCGTSVAGIDPKKSVVDQYCKSHDLDNLYLIDGGFFPSSAAMNPALTIAAQALRVVNKSDLKEVN
jgi:choline dehydrogenase-like flavoprotein